MKTTRLSVSFVLLLVITACNLPTPGGLVPPSVIDSARGTWTGTLNDLSAGIVYTVDLILEQPESGTSILGTLTLTSQTDSYPPETYQITGEFDGSAIEFSEPEGRFFWGTVDSLGMRGQAGWCYRCEAWGEFNLTLQTATSTNTSGSSATIRLVDLQDGSIVSATIAENGFPLVESRVETTGRLPIYAGLALEVDGLWVNQALTDGNDPFSAALPWTPWHGNGEYVLTVQALDPETNDLLAAQTVHVTVNGIPSGTPTVSERMIQIYQEQFGLTLTAPAFARYTKPTAYAVEESRWVSTAYIGDHLYEINIFDNGFTGALAYDLDSENGFCRPAGKYSMLVVFVNYGNTGLDPAPGLAPMVQWQLDANRYWADYSTSVGLSEPILQIDQMETAIVSIPPDPGQALTVDQVRTITGKDPSDFDWLVEIDLDANNSFAGQFGGLGASLNGGCLSGGAQRVNIAFSAVDESTLLVAAPGSVFGHELEHGMGWEHWWPNGLADNAGLRTRSEFWMPVLLFGWSDTDGDGMIEILDTSTPYGLVP